METERSGREEVKAEEVGYEMLAADIEDVGRGYNQGKLNKARKELLSSRTSRGSVAPYNLGFVPVKPILGF